MLTAEQLARYREQGFLIIEDVLTPEEVATARAAVDEWVERSREVPESDATFDLEPGHTRNTPRLRRLKEPFTKSEVFAKLACHPIVLDILEDIIGPDIRFQASKLNMKSAEFGSALEWHQDVAFYPHTNDDLCAVGVYLDDADLDNGCMLVIPGSHEGPVLDHNTDEYFVGAPDQHHVLIAEGEHVPVVVRAGGISIHHVRTFHASAPNTSGRPRRLLLNQYTAADAYPVQFTIAEPGQLVRGTPAEYMRFSSQAPVPVQKPMPPHAGSIYAVQAYMRETTFKKASS